jgi:hypothetical protein
MLGQSEARMYQFTTRDLVLSTAMTAICVAWWQDRQRILVNHDKSLSVAADTIHLLAQERDNAINERNWLKRELAVSTLPGDVPP